MDFEAFWSGWRNHLIPPKDLKEIIQKISDERLSFCISCQFNSKNDKPNPEGKVGFCKMCLCPLKAKSKALNHSCPDTPPKWGAYINDDERKILDEQLKVDNAENKL